MKQNFIIGSAAGLLIFALLNLISAHLSSDCGLFAVFGLDACADDIARAGWPLQFYEAGGFAFRSNFSPLFLLIDTAIGLGLALFSGWIYARNKKTLSK
jgi:ABC-type antimicrobial peptide transport system permease subunit